MEFSEWNTGRCYPLLEATASRFIPLTAVVGCGFIVGPGSGFIDGQHRVRLTSVSLVGSTIFFEFSSDAPGLSGETVVFSRDVSDAPYITEFSEAGPSDSLSDSLLCSVDDAFSGYLVTGPLDELVAALALDATLTGDAIVEPALIQNLSQAFVRSINIANGDRTRYSTPEDCDPIEWPVEQQPLYVAHTCVQGPLRFKAGYNSGIRQNAFDNSLTFDATVGGGLGEPCEQIPVYAGEVPPEGSELLDGGPSCRDVFRTINGAGGRVVPVSGGLGVSVTFKPNSSEITIDVNTQDMTVCSTTTQVPAELLDCSSYSGSAEGDM